MNKKKWTLLAVFLLLLISATAWAFWTPGTDPQVAKIQALRAQIESAPSDQRRALFGQMREEYEKLTPEARDALRADRRNEWQERERKWMGEFFAMPYAQQIASIDKQIDDREKRRERWAQKQASQGGDLQNSQAQGGGRGGDAGGGRGPGGARSSDPLQRRKDYLDRTTPMDRAQRSAYREMMQQRRQQRGLGG